MALQGLSADRVCLGMSTQQDVVIFDAAQLGLPFAMREAYHADLRAWVVACCREAIARDARPRVRQAGALLDALCDGTGCAIGFARWSSIGPHATLRRELALS